MVISVVKNEERKHLSHPFQNSAVATQRFQEFGHNS